MPQNNEKQEKPSFLKSVFSVPAKWPELEQALADKESVHPDETKGLRKVFQMGPLFKMMNPDAYAVTGPFGTVAMNRELIEKDKQDVADVLTHELAHVQQGKSGFLRKLYNPSAVEDEAINKEAMRKVIRGDIVIPPERKR